MKVVVGLEALVVDEADVLELNVDGVVEDVDGD